MDDDIYVVLWTQDEFDSWEGYQAGLTLGGVYTTLHAAIASLPRSESVVVMEHVPTKKTCEGQTTWVIIRCPVNTPINKHLFGYAYTWTSTYIVLDGIEGGTE